MEICKLEDDITEIVNSLKECTSTEDRDYLREKEKQLREKKKQLREEEKQLREHMEKERERAFEMEKLLMMMRQQPGLHILGEV